MSTAILSIKPEYIEKIFSRIKKYEFRKVKFKRPVDKIVFYCTSPVKAVVGEANVDEVIYDTPANIWNKTKKHSGTTKEYFDQYYMKSKLGVAYKLSNVVQYEKTKELKEYNINFVPQSFMYID